jgi:hypothetical protein
MKKNRIIEIAVKMIVAVPMIHQKESAERFGTFG